MFLVAFDFDGTLSPSEMTVLLGERRGVADEMAAITDRAMNDEIDYATSLRERAALLDGLSIEEAETAFDGVTLRPGAGKLLENLNDAGVETAILTGGFERGVETALANAGVTVDHVVANRLPRSAGALTGDVDGPLVEGTKDEALATLVERVGGSPTTVAVGDGANDRPMLAVADVAIGFDPKPAVTDVCDDIVISIAELRERFEEMGLLEGGDRR